MFFATILTLNRFNFNKNICIVFDVPMYCIYVHIQTREMYVIIIAL